MKLTTKELMNRLMIDKIFNHKIESLKKQLEKEVYSKLPSAFRLKNKHIVTLPYMKRIMNNKFLLNLGQFK